MRVLFPVCSGKAVKDVSGSPRLSLHWSPLFSDQFIKRWTQLDPDRTYLHTQDGIPSQPNVLLHGLHLILVIQSERCDCCQG